MDGNKVTGTDVPDSVFYKTAGNAAGREWGTCQGK